MHSESVDFKLKMHMSCALWILTTFINFVGKAKSLKPSSDSLKAEGPVEA